MKRLVRFGILGIAIALIAALIVPALAQEPGQGGIIIEGNFGGDPANLNPILATDTSSFRIINLIYPGFVGVNPETATYEKGRPDALVSDWTVSDDGLVYTFTMRQDWTWNDGTPITSKDYQYTWDAITSGVVDTRLTYLMDIIDKVETPDDYTVVVTFKEADCTALGNASLPVVPSHVLPSDFAALNDSEFNLNPTVTSGPFNFSEFRAAELVSLTANQAYPANPNGVIPEGFIYKVVPDQTVLIEQFLAGETNFIDGPAVNRRSDLRASEDVNVYSFPGNAWDYLSLNYADPTNPQNAFDEAGNPIDQGHHPFFADVRVRKAIALALNVDEMIQGAVFGEGDRMASTIIPASWAYDKNLPFIPYDPEAAAALLDEAGFVDHDGNVDTPRIAQGALYAEDGTEFRFTLYTNEGNTRRGAIATIVQDSLKQLGIVVDFQAIDFNTLLDIMDGQEFDAFILGWRNGYPDDPDQTQLFSPNSDVVGSGSNNSSYNNPRVTELMEQARTLPGCDPTERAAIYAEIQKLMQDDVAYVPLFTIGGMYAARKNVDGFAPYPSQPFWNIDTWAVRSE
jgi:peptide/nickel transport system substrate-binding protein